MNALSTRLEVEVKRQGHVWRQSFRDGGVPLAPLAQGEASDETGTTITFWPDATIFDTVDFDYDTLRTRFQQMAFLNKGLRISLRDERPDAVVTEGEPGEEVTAARHDSFLYERGLVDYVEHLNRVRKADVVNDEVIEVESEDTDRKIALELAMQWTTAYTENVFTYANTINTHEGGTHEEGFRAALTTLVNRYARANNLLKDKDDNLTGEDIREGLTAVISVKLSEPQFEGQTKTKLGNTEARAFVQKVVGDKLATGSTATPRRPRTSSGRPSTRPPRASPPARPARPLGARASSSPRPCPTSSRTARRKTLDQRDLPRRG